MCNINYILPPQVIQFWEDKAKSYGPIVAGALFGAGWWFWIDAVVCNDHTVPFPQYIPGIIATLALFMINVVRREELAEYDSFDDASFCRARLWLFLSYVVSFGAITGAVWVLLQHYATNPDLTVHEKWPGVAGLFQVGLILGSGLLFFISRTSNEGGFGGYSGF